MMDKDKNIHHGGSGTSYKGAEILKFLIPSLIGVILFMFQYFTRNPNNFSHHYFSWDGDG